MNLASGLEGLSRSCSNSEAVNVVFTESILHSRERTVSTQREAETGVAIQKAQGKVLEDLAKKTMAET